MTVLAAVDRDLEEIRKRAPAMADSALAASARVLARELDDPSNSATSKSMCAKALREALDRLAELTPPAKQENELDRVRRERERRLRSAAS